MVPLETELETGAAPHSVWELSVCLASIQKSSTLPSTARLEISVNRGLKKSLKVTYVHSGINSGIYSGQILFNILKMWKVFCQKHERE